MKTLKGTTVGPICPLYVLCVWALKEQGPYALRHARMHTDAAILLENPLPRAKHLALIAGP